jgi:hypothetical protein
MRRVQHVAQMGAKRLAYRLLMRGKGQLGKPACRWVDNIKMVLEGIGWGGVDWFRLAQDRDRWRAPVKTATILRSP